MRRKAQVMGIAVMAAGLLALPAAATAHVQNGPTSMTYPDRVAGTQSDPQTETVVVFCTVPNGGNPVLCSLNDTFTPNPTFTGANPGDFSQTNNCGAGISNVPGINPGVNSCQFFITFKPTAQGTRTATLNLGTGQTGAQPAPVSLSGVGLTAANAPGGSGGSGTTTPGKKCKKKAKKGSAQIAKKKCKKK